MFRREVFIYFSEERQERSSFGGGKRAGSEAGTYGIGGMYSIDGTHGMFLPIPINLFFITL